MACRAVAMDKGDCGADESTVTSWGADFQRLMEQVGPCFSRHDLRCRASRYVHGLLGQVDRKNGWQLAEYLGDQSPYRVQRLLGRASWDADEVRDEVLRYVRQHLLTPDEGGILVVDETGFLKKRDKSVGVQRQYSGTAGTVRIYRSSAGILNATLRANQNALQAGRRV